MSSAPPPTEYFPGINFNPSFYNLGQSAVTLDYLNSNFLRSTGYAISRAQFTLFNGSVDINENLDVSGNINASAYLVNNIPVSFSQWTTSNNDIYYNTGNVGIGKTNPSANYILDVSGNINADKIFRAGTELTQYTDTDVRNFLATEDESFPPINIPRFEIKSTTGAPFFQLVRAAGSITYSGLVYISPIDNSKFCFDVGGGVSLEDMKIHFRQSGDDKLVIKHNETITYNSIKFANNNNLIFNGSYNELSDKPTLYTDTNTRTVLSTSAGANMTWNTGTNKFDVSVATPYTDANTRTVLSNSAGTNMTWNTGTNKFDVNVISSQWTTTGTEIYYSTGKVGIGLTNPSSSGATLQVTGTVSLSSSANTSLFWSGNTNTLLGRANTAGTYSSSAAVGDLVLSSNNKIIIKSGASTNPIAMCVDTSNNVGIGKTNPSQNLDVSGNILALRLGVGTTSILSNYSLDVSGNIITTGNIALVNGATSIFWTGTNSNLGRAGTGNTYSTSAATNDIVLRSANKLLLQSGVGAAALVIDTANNIGIGNTAPIGPLTIGNGSIANQDGFMVLEKCTTVGTTRQFRIGLNANFDLVIGDYGGGNVAGTWKEQFKIAYGTVANTLSLFGDYVGIGVTPSYKCHIKCTYNDPNRGLHLDAGDTTDANKYGLTIWSYVIGSGQVGWRFKTQSQTGGINTPLAFTNDGTIRFQSGRWHSCDNGNQRFYYASGDTTYLRGHGATPFVFRSGADTDLVNITSGGNVGIGKTPGYKLDVNGEINATNVRVNGVDINQMIKNQHLFHIYRVSITYYNFGLIGQYWEGVWDVETNLKFNEYSRPDLNVRWNISGSINNGNGNDSNKYFFMNFFYNKLGNSIQYHTTHSYGTWTFQNYWGSQGNNFLRIICRLDAAADYLNINIS